MSTIHAAGVAPSDASRPETAQPDPVDGVVRDLDRIGHHYAQTLTIAVQRELTAAGVRPRARGLLAAVLAVLDGGRVPADRSRAIYAPLLAAMSDIAPGHIARYANELAAAGLLKVERRSKRRPTLYARGDRLLGLTQPRSALDGPVVDNADAPMWRGHTAPIHHGGASREPPPAQVWSDGRTTLEARSRHIGGPADTAKSMHTAHCSDEQPRNGRGALSINEQGERGDPPPCDSCDERVEWHRNQQRWFRFCALCYKMRRDRGGAAARPRHPPVLTPIKPRPKPDPAERARIDEAMARVKEAVARAGSTGGRNTS